MPLRYAAPLIQQSLHDDRVMAFLCGPRQVGKTTLAKALLRTAAAYFNWDIATDRQRIMANPERFWEMEAGPGQRIVLDEIHKYPRWKRFLKGLFDAVAPEIEILVTGSGRLDVYQRGGDSLAGRYHLIHLYPFTVGELLRADRQSLRTPDEAFRAIFDHAPPAGNTAALNQIDRFSGFPAPLFAATETRLRRWRQTYRQVVVREDLRDLTRIRELGLVDQLMLLLPHRVGAPLSINALREELAVAFTTVQSWLLALARLYVLFELRPFAGKLARTLRREGKIYLFDHTLLEDPGARFENLTALHLAKACAAWTDAGFGEFTLHYVRDKEQREVDFLICEARRPYALIECKLNDAAPSPHLRYFHERLRPKYALQLLRQHATPNFLSHRKPLWLCTAARCFAQLP
ncbi:MAG: ATP-binding protein [Deltaproteobacteria bacterium]|nr:ATP-binding protein [Deltaproteobacteria bacterium]